MAKHVFVTFLVLAFALALPVLGQDCRATFSSACAVRNAYNLATKTYNALIAAQTPTQLENIWHEITYGNTYRIAGGFHAFVFDWADHCKAHGGNPMNVGIELKDIIWRDNFCTSVNIGEILRGAANVTGGSWAQYQWLDSLTPNWPAARRAWVRKFNLFRTNYYVGVAYVDTDADWELMPCNQRRSHFCSQENAFNLAQCASRDLKAACSGIEVDNFLALVNSKARYRMNDNFYLTVNLFSGTQVGNGLISSFVGKTIAKITEDLKIFDFVPRNLQEQLRFAAANHTGAWVSHPWTNVVSGSTSDTYTFSVYSPALNIDYFITSSFVNEYEAMCPDCNCIACPTQPVCDPCPAPPVETVTEIAFKFKGLTCAGGDDMKC